MDSRDERREAAFGRLEVSEGGGQGIGGIGGGEFGQSKNGLHHEGDLIFCCGTASDGGAFDFAGGELVDGKPVFGGGEKGGTSCGAQKDRGLVALDIDRAFDDKGRGGMAFDDFVEDGVDFQEASGDGEFFV